MDLLEKFVADKANIGKVFTSDGKKFKVVKAENFEYTDPIDKSVASKQVFIFLIFFSGMTFFLFIPRGQRSNRLTFTRFVAFYELCKN